MGTRPVPRRKAIYVRVRVRLAAPDININTDIGRAVCELAAGVSTFERARAEVYAHIEPLCAINVPVKVLIPWGGTPGMGGSEPDQHDSRTGGVLRS